mgnify:CR=1 FL=1
MILALPKKISEINKANRQLKIAIVKSSYYPNLCRSLEKACREHLIISGVNKNNIETFAVPGSWEIPLIVKKIAQAKKFDGIVALGVIIKGETYHFELVSNESGAGITRVGLDAGLPVANAILTTEDDEQAEVRMQEKGADAARVAVEMANLCLALEELAEGLEDLIS